MNANQFNKKFKKTIIALVALGTMIATPLSVMQTAYGSTPSAPSPHVVGVGVREEEEENAEVEAAAANLEKEAREDQFGLYYMHHDGKHHRKKLKDLRKTLKDNGIVIVDSSGLEKKLKDAIHHTAPDHTAIFGATSEEIKPTVGEGTHLSTTYLKFDGVATLVHSDGNRFFVSDIKIGKDAETFMLKRPNRWSHHYRKGRSKAVHTPKIKDRLLELSKDFKRGFLTELGLQKKAEGIARNANVTNYVSAVKKSKPPATSSAPGAVASAP